jgi:dimethylargininase
MLHLKSGAAYLENNKLVVAGEFKYKPDFEKFDRIAIPENEDYAANCLWINDRVLIADGYTKTKMLIEHAGFQTITLDMSEFRKLDGGLSCLSLRF